MSERGKMREVVVFRYTSKVYVVDRNRRKKQIHDFSFFVVVEQWKMPCYCGGCFSFS